MTVETTTIYNYLIFIKVKKGIFSKKSSFRSEISFLSRTEAELFLEVYLESIKDLLDKGTKVLRVAIEENTLILKEVESSKNEKV